MIIDTHAHLNFKDYDKDREDVIKRALKEGVFVINIGTNYKTSREAVEIAEDYREGVYASVGLHPIYKEEFKEEDYKELLKSKKVVAIGEVGLDKKYPHKEQFSLFQKQLKLAEEHSLPLVLHCRMAHKEMREEISNYNITGVVHCFTGSKQDARDYIKKGFYLGFNGVIFKTSLDTVIKETPLDRILLETDSPYLTPPTEKGRNEPLYIKHVLKRVAEIKNLKIKEVEDATFKNAEKLFKIDKK